ncbi:MAG: hypothetical protein QXZ47_00080 [Candidatus Bathyarchaeia archaeon]
MQNQKPSPWITTHSDIILKEIKQLEQALKAINPLNNTILKA